MAREIQDLTECGRAGKLQRRELADGTFAIESPGSLGGVLTTPIVNYPEVAIRGVHRIVKRPSYQTDGCIGPASLMNLSVSSHHRVLDDIVGVDSLATVKAYLRNPHQLFAVVA